MESNELKAALEAILFLSSDPVRIDDLAESLEESKEAVASSLDEIRRTLEEHVGGFMLEQAAGGWRLTTRAEHDSTLKKYFAKKGENRLSLAALETLAIVAYRQPITAPEVSDIRGVNSTGVIRTLLERRMIRVAGRKNVVGSPFLYRTTKDFLIHFGLNDIRDLPRLEEFGDLIGENIGDDLVAAINAAEPGSDALIEPGSEMSEGDAAPTDSAIGNAESHFADGEESIAADDSSIADEDRAVEDGTTFEQDVETASEESQLESDGGEANKE